MRLSAILTTAVALLLAPTALADPPSGASWGGETTITITSSYETTLTVTKTLTWANVTLTSTISSPHNATTIAVSTSSPAKATGSSVATKTTGLIAEATGAANNNQGNLAMAAIAGAAVMVLGSL
ncbi:hypothetical protein B0A52_06248 [Exophiala mesophila]|uniref:Uncharacterized protein n=1 Tax=Exophiala mesophila TaxID=212818 RepID=A0A438N2X4_EXOME|nr:hypothetical protein B0A52_06248 [Exophiala mesophila]